MQTDRRADQQTDNRKVVSMCQSNYADNTTKQKRKQLNCRKTTNEHDLSGSFFKIYQLSLTLYKIENAPAKFLKIENSLKLGLYKISAKHPQEKTTASIYKHVS